VSDGGTYELVVGPPGAAARIEAFEEIAALLWSDTAPTMDDFAMARTFYEIDEGLSSRVDRREDLHYPEIPMDEWDPGLESDKQCANAMLAEAYPDRCVGPSKIRPLINQAFVDGIEGTGDPNVNAARIKAGLLWFIYLSTYKESYSCFTISGEDCDAAWGYWTGGAQIDGDLIGMAQMVQAISPNAGQHIFDGLLAVRCVRDLYPEEDYPPAPIFPLTGADLDLFNTAWEQLDQGLHRGMAVVLRQHAEAQDSCGDSAAANWEFIKIIGGWLVREATERDSAAGAELDALTQLDTATPEDITALIGIIDTVFDCP
jgi:hypothetical protein